MIYADKISKFYHLELLLVTDVWYTVAWRANPFSGPVVEQINHLAANVHSWDELRDGNLLSSV